MLALKRFGVGFSKDLKIVRQISCTCPNFIHFQVRRQQPQPQKSQNGPSATPTLVLGVWLPKRLKGHSQYENGKWQRQAAYEKRAKIFGKLTLEIMRTVRDKGADPKTNPTLETLRIRARNAGMPKETVENAIKRVQKGGSGAEMESNIVVQAKGPGKSLLMIDVLSGNSVRSVGEIRRILKRNNGVQVEDNSLTYLFSRKGVVTLDSTTRTQGTLGEEEAEEVAIMIGAENIILDSDEDDNTVFHLTCSPGDLGMLEKSLADEYEDVKVLSSGVQYLPDLLSDVGANIAANETLLDMLNEHEDVVAVYDNIQRLRTATIKVQKSSS